MDQFMVITDFLLLRGGWGLKKVRSLLSSYFDRPLSEVGNRKFQNCWRLIIRLFKNSKQYFINFCFAFSLFDCVSDNAVLSRTLCLIERSCRDRDPSTRTFCNYFRYPENTAIKLYQIGFLLSIQERKIYNFFVDKDIL